MEKEQRLKRYLGVTIKTLCVRSKKGRCQGRLPGLTWETDSHALPARASGFRGFCFLSFLFGEWKVHEFGFACVKFTMSLKHISGNIKLVASGEIYFQSQLCY